MNLAEQAKAELAKRELARRHLLEAVKYHFPGYDVNWHHEVIAEKLELIAAGELKRLIITMPPRHGKSELASIHFPAWYIGKYPDKEIIAASYSADLSGDFGRKVRNMFQDDEKWQNIFPDVSLAQDSKSASKWNIKGRKGAYLAVGVGGAATGKGADCLIIDDPFKNRQEAESPIIRQSVWEWYTSTARTRLGPDGAIIVVITRWHDSDLVGMLQMQEQEQSRHQWEVINFPAIAEKDEEIRYHKLVFGLDGKLQRQPISFFRKKGTALWPSRFSLENLLETKKDISPYDWSSLYQQNPVDAESAVFEKGWFQEIDEERVKEKMTRRFLTIDTAGPMTSQSNYTGVIDNRVDSDGYWNIKAKRYQISPAALVDLIFALDEKNQYEKIGIEKTIFLSALQPFIESEAIRRGKESRFSGDGSIIAELKHNQTAKEIRIRGLIPFYKNGIIKHVKGECENLIPQLRRFPKGSDDDLIDALAYQTQIAEAPYGWTKEYKTEQERAEKDFDPHNPLSEI
jgi:hypothetical protein